MRVEPHAAGSILHVIKRGGRGLDIVRDEEDRQRFVRSLFYLNDEHVDPWWHRTTASLIPPQRPAHWPDRRPLVHILAWTLLPNHFHLLLEEVQEGGIAIFMQGLCGSMTKMFNAKYESIGSIFQGGYRGKVIDTDTYLHTVFLYIVVKNVLEQYPGGLTAAMQSFDDAWKWGLAFPFSSLAAHAGAATSPIIAQTELLDVLMNRETLKQRAYEMLLAHTEKHTADDALDSLILEKW